MGIVFKISFLTLFLSQQSQQSKSADLDISPPPHTLHNKNKVMLPSQIPHIIPISHQTTKVINNNNNTTTTLNINTLQSIKPKTRQSTKNYALSQPQTNKDTTTARQYHSHRINRKHRGPKPQPSTRSTSTSSIKSNTSNISDASNKSRKTKTKT